MGKINQDRLQELLHYNPIVGVFTWIDPTSNKVKVGDIAGCDNGKGYVKIQIKGCRFYAHRLAWLYMTGEFPDSIVDHKNQNRSDNRWCNLRKATKSQNMINKQKIKNNTSGYIGVCWHKKAAKYEAYVASNKIKYYLGLFDSAKEAAQVRDNKAIELFGEYAGLNFNKKYTGPTEFVGR